MFITSLSCAAPGLTLSSPTALALVHMECTRFIQQFSVLSAALSLCNGGLIFAKHELILHIGEEAKQVCGKKYLKQKLPFIWIDVNSICVLARAVLRAEPSLREQRCLCVDAGLTIKMRAPGGALFICVCCLRGKQSEDPGS